MSAAPQPLAQQIEMPRRRLLVVSPYFLPSEHPSARRAWQLVTFLRSEGWSSTVVAVGPQDVELSPYEERHSAHIDTRWVATRLLNRGLDAIWALPGIDASGGPNRAGAQLALNLPALHARLAAERYDAVLSTGPSMLGHLTARALRPKLPWLADIEPPPAPHHTAGRLDEAAARARGRAFSHILERASAITLTSRAAIAHLKERWPNAEPRLHLLYDSFDSRLYTTDLGSAAFKGRAANPKPRLDCMILGWALDDSDLSVWIDTLKQIRSQHPDISPFIKLRHIPELPSGARKRLLSHGLGDHFERLPQLDRSETLELLSRQDLLLASTPADSPYSLPPMLPEAIAAGRPILSISANGEMAEILKRTQAGHHFSVGHKRATTDAAALISGCAEAKRTGRRMPIPTPISSRQAHSWNAKTTAAVLGELLDSLISAQSV